jgi:hypothetical protein
MVPQLAVVTQAEAPTAGDGRMSTRSPGSGSFQIAVCPSDDDFQLDAAQLEYIPISEHVRQVGCQALPVEKRAIGAAGILNQVSGPSAMDLAVVTRDATLKPPIWCEVQVNKDTVDCVQTSDVHLGSGGQLGLASCGNNLDAQRGTCPFAPFIDELAGPRVR